MVELETLPATAPREDILEAFRRDGACILADALPLSQCDALMTEVMPFVDQTRPGRDGFTGFNTRRTGALISRCPASRPIVTDATVVGLAEAFLGQFAPRIILHLTQTIYIEPGQGAQPIHRDRQAWGDYLPLTIEPQFNTIWALTDFTADNGATRVVPGSNHWDWEQRATPEEICQAEMARGSVLLYSGSVLHSGGENRTETARMGLNITYCLSWLRQEENQYLSCPPAVAKELDIDLQELLGYTMGNYALGYYSDPDGQGENGAGILPPERALGATSRNKLEMLE